jgi:UDP-N-acetylmuramoyl-tripeptide--D-alanyl-D-alanine ligase
MATVEAVARENGSVFQSLDAAGTAVFPADDDYTPLWRELVGARKVLTFALSGAADVTGSAQWEGGRWKVAAVNARGQHRFLAAHRRAAQRQERPGRHGLRAGGGRAAGCDLPRGCRPLCRSRAVRRAIAVALPGRVLTLVDDSYNANPDSMRAALEVLAELPGPRLMVMGDMGEVGDQGPQFHDEAGRHARALGIEKTVHAGRAIAKLPRRASATRGLSAGMDELAAAVLAELPHTGSVLVKGSRFMKMERVVQAVTGRAQDPTHHQQQQKDEPHAA